MRTWRWVGAVLFMLGLAVSGLVLDAPPHPQLVAGGYTVLAADLHVHGFPDGIPAWDAAREAQRRRIDVIALTSHNSRFGWWMWTHRPSWAVTPDVLVLPGEELTSVGYHLAIVGLSRAIGWDQSIASAAAAAHRQGAVAILAHPAGAALKRAITDDGLRAVDGVEVAHCGRDDSGEWRRRYREIFDRAVALDPGTAAIGSSDFHYGAPLGICRTYLFVHDRGANAVLDAIRQGRTVACDVRGTTFGPPDLRALVSDRCRDEASAPADGDSIALRLATALVWAGLFVLVLAGAAGT